MPKYNYSCLIECQHFHLITTYMAIKSPPSKTNPRVESTFCTRLKKTRGLRKKTQQQLADIVGIKQQAVQRIEAGKVKSSSYVVPLAVALEVDPIWLSEGPGDEPAVLTTDEVREKHAEYTTLFSTVPLYEWKELSQALESTKVAEKVADYRERIPYPRAAIGSNVFAIRFHPADGAMSSFDGKISFQREDILVVDPDKVPASGDFVLAKVPPANIVLRRYVSDNLKGAHLEALHPKHVSVSCGRNVKILCALLQRLTPL
jgi:transcriptional regulator with XRE-family HTH domain